MKKILIIFLVFLSNFYVSYAKDLDVKANIESWKYDFVLEVNLIANKDWAKIFYYTDWEWRMDHIIEFTKWNPIIIKKDTILNYYAIWENYEETKIMENKYSFDYEKNLNLEYKNWKIFIKNNDNDVLNIWYYRLEWDNLNYEIYKDTFVEKWKSFELNYELKNNESIKLIAPNWKIITSYTYKEQKKEEVKKVEETKEIQKQEESPTIELEAKEVENITDENTKNQEEIKIEEVKNDDISKQEDQTNVEKKDDFNISNEIKASTQETNNSNKIFLNLFFMLIIWIFFYNSFILYKKLAKK